VADLVVAGGVWWCDTPHYLSEYSLR
jgi:hypothetical protein